MQEVQTQASETEILKVKERIDKERACKIVLYKMLEFCKEPRRIDAIVAQTLSYPQMAVPVQTPEVLLTWLLECGGVVQVQNEQDFLYQTSQAGVLALKEEQSEDKIQTLIDNDKEYKEIYLKVLNLCKEPKTRRQIEEKIDCEPILQNPKIYSSYFVEGLEKAGGLEWSGAWRITQRGLEKLKG